MNVPHTEVVALRNGEEIYRAVLPPGDYVIGREVGMSIRLPSDKISRKHAQLSLTYYDWLIEDFESANGTFVGGRAVKEATLIFPQQDVRVGNVQLHLRRLPMTYEPEMIAPQTEALLRFLPLDLRGGRKYKVHGIIAMGGMGAVLEAEDMAMRRRVAMKVLLDAKSAEDVARFIEEAQITSQLEHPNIVPVYELNVNELDKPFYVMKLVRGESLAAVIKRLAAEEPAALQRYGLGDLLSILSRVCDALAFAHSKGVVHRDLKPDNIMLGEFGETVVMDWGLAKPLGQSANGVGQGLSIRTVVRSVRHDHEAIGTEIGSAIGTPQYMSPEQAAGQSHAVDARSDVYAVGALLYAILTLRPPVSGANVMETLDNVVAGRIPPITEVVRRHAPKHLPGGRLPPELIGATMKALSLDPQDRYATMREMQTALREARLAGGGWLRLEGLFRGPRKTDPGA